MSKSAMENSFDSVSAVSPGREGWRLKVRVLRLWEVSSFLNPEQPNSIEMVLIDDKVTAALADSRLESSNLIVGIDFTKSNEWTGKSSFS